MNAAGVCVRALAVDPTGKRVAVATEYAYIFYLVSAS
jgi:hypothetical protein